MSSGAKDGIMVSLISWYVSLKSLNSLFVVYFSLVSLLSLQVAVVAALSALCEEYYKDQAGQADPQIQGRLNMVS